MCLCIYICIYIHIHIDTHVSHSEALPVRSKMWIHTFIYVYECMCDFPHISGSIIYFYIYRYVCVLTFHIHIFAYENEGKYVHFIWTNITYMNIYVTDNYKTRLAAKLVGSRNWYKYIYIYIYVYTLAFYLKVPKSCTDLDLDLLYILIFRTCSKIRAKNKMLALGVCFPQSCLNARFPHIGYVWIITEQLVRFHNKSSMKRFVN